VEEESSGNSNREEELQSKQSASTPAEQGTMTTEESSKGQKWLPRSFRVTFDQAVSSPLRQNPIFPPYCVQCCKEATTYTEEMHIIRKPQGERWTRRGMRETYLTVTVNLKIPWCAEHRSLRRKRKVVMFLSASLPMLAMFAFFIVQDLREPGSMPSWLWVLLGVGSMVVGMALMFLVPRMMGLPGPLSDVGITAEVKEKPPMLKLRFDNREYAAMFVEANEQ
jgi:hypothetical protein